MTAGGVGGAGDSSHGDVVMEVRDNGDDGR